MNSQLTSDVFSIYDENRKQLGDEFVLLLTHEKIHTPIKQYIKWKITLADIEQYCENNTNWGIEFHQCLVDFCIQNNELAPSIREKIIILLTLFLVVKGAGITIDEMIVKRYNMKDDGTILKDIETALVDLYRQKIYFPAEGTSIVYLSNTLVTFLPNIASKFDEKTLYIHDFICLEREIVKLDENEIKSRLNKFMHPDKLEKMMREEKREAENLHKSDKLEKVLSNKKIEIEEKYNSLISLVTYNNSIADFLRKRIINTLQINYNSDLDEDENEGLENNINSNLKRFSLILHSQFSNTRSEFSREGWLKLALLTIGPILYLFTLAR